MKLLLTSAGVRNASIRAALDELLPGPLDDCTALCIPTAMYGHPHASPVRTSEFVAGRSDQPQVELGWKSVGLLELSALPSLPQSQWRPLVEQCDVLLASGGDAVYLAHWMRESGLLGVVRERPELVWIGMSASSMVMAPQIGVDFVHWQSPSRTDATLGLVDFAIFPHLDHPQMSGNTITDARRWAATLTCSAYAIDDETAIVVDGSQTKVVGEGAWQYFSAPANDPDLRTPAGGGDRGR